MPAAKSGPLPPKANSAYSRGSRPRSLETARMARIMFDAAMTCAPCAASASGRARPRGTLALDTPRARRVELHGAAGQLPGIEEAEDDVGVGDGRLGPSEVVAERSRRRAGALG